VADSTPFSTQSGRKTTAFTRIDYKNKLIRSYVQGLADAIHELMEFLIFPADSSIPPSQRHTRAFLAEVIAGGRNLIVRDHSIAIPHSFFDQLDRMSIDQMALFFREYDHIRLAMKDKFNEGPDSYAFLERAMLTSEFMHALVVMRLHGQLWWIFSQRIKKLSEALVRPSYELKKQKALYPSDTYSTHLVLHWDNITAALSYYLSEQIMPEDILMQRLDEQRPDDLFALKEAERIFRTAMEYLRNLPEPIASDELLNLYAVFYREEITPFQALLAAIQKSPLLKKDLPPEFEVQMPQVSTRRPELERSLLVRACAIMMETFRREPKERRSNLSQAG
jgi:hypothetical protein